MTNLDWLDKIVEEQAAHYGLSVPAYTSLMNDAAEQQQIIEQLGEDS